MVATLAIFFYVGAMLLLPAPRPNLQLLVTSGSVDTGKPKVIPWPENGDGALSSANTLLAAHSTEKPRQTASVAKIILTLTLLKDKPIQPGSQGPMLTLTSRDVAFYNSEVARVGSVVQVVLGEQLTQYQALQALLLASGNNIADTLATWAFGSEQNYVTKANAMLAEMKLSKTHVADASGFSPQTVSTPAELVAIGEKALQNPVIAQIVAQKQATLPVAGAIQNTNKILGINGINGIKTGHNLSSGGCLLFSATRAVSGQNVTLVGAIQGASSLDEAFATAPKILDAGYENFVSIKNATEGQIIGTVTTEWGSTAEIKPAKYITQVVWAGSKLERTVTAQPKLNGTVGTLTVGGQTTELVLGSDIPPPTAYWRLTHPVQMLSDYFKR